jgi:hypothetical protein
MPLRRMLWINSLAHCCSTPTSRAADDVARGTRHRREINRFVRLRIRNGLRGFGRIRDVSISGGWIATEQPPKLMSYVQVLAILLVHPRKSQMSTAKQGSPS